MDEYSPNSHKMKEEAAKAQEKRVGKVVSSPVKQRKKSEFRKLTDIFIAEDITSVKSYILTDVIVPAIKDAIEDIVHMLLRGGNDNRGRKRVPASKVSYRSYYEQERDRDRRSYSDLRAGNVYDYDDYIIETRGEAEDVLSRMDDLIATYGVVSVGDFYDLLGVPGNYTDNKYGWTNIRNAQVIRVKEGYTIKFPKAMPIN